MNILLPLQSVSRRCVSPNSHAANSGGTLTSSKIVVDRTAQSADMLRWTNAWVEMVR